MNLKIKVLFCVVLSLFCAKMDAKTIYGLWRGEDLSVKSRETKTYYIYAMTTDPSKRGFLGSGLFGDEYRPVLRDASLNYNENYYCPLKKVIQNKRRAGSTL